MSKHRLKKIVYIPLGAEILHSGHIGIIREGRKLGRVVIGLLSDRVIANKDNPIMSYEQRLEIINNIKGIDDILPQNKLVCYTNLSKLKPDFVLCFKDLGAKSRQQIIDIISVWGGKLIKLNYSEDIKDLVKQKRQKVTSISPAERLTSLNKALMSKRTIRLLEAHNGISALVVENVYINEPQGSKEEFDAIWVSSLTDSIAKGKPDIEVVDSTSRIATINEILEVTSKPLVVDGDTGGNVDHFVYMVRTLERLGVSAVVIEDKNGLKRNSLYNKPDEHTQEDPNVFSSKIRAGVAVRASSQFMIIARIESFILGKDLADALNRAKTYLDAGASAIMIHSNDKSGNDVRNFAAAYNKITNRKPLMLIPTSYNKINERELSDWGGNIIVYANHLLRAAYPAMARAAQCILENQRSFEAESLIIPIDSFLKLVPEP